MYPAIVPIYALFSDTLGVILLIWELPPAPFHTPQSHLHLYFPSSLFVGIIDIQRWYTINTLTLDQFINALSIGGGLVAAAYRNGAH
jgi:hypothetical protein